MTASPVTTARNPAAERMAACRDRKQRGYRCATVEVSAAEIDALVSVGLLTEGERNHRTALVRKISKWLWT